MNRLAGCERGDENHGFTTIAFLHQAEVGELNERLGDHAFLGDTVGSQAFDLNKQRRGRCSGEYLLPVEFDHLALIKRFPDGEGAVKDLSA